MATFLTISVGSAARTAKAILATHDPRVIRAALVALVKRVGVDPGIAWWCDEGPSDQAEARRT